MAQPFPLDSEWSLGMRQDVARDSMPPGAAWKLVNLIPDTLQAPLRKRGGWQSSAVTLTAITNIGQMCWAPFTGGSKLLGIDNGTGNLWNLLTATNIGAVYTGVQNPFFYRNKVIFPNSDGTTAIKYYDGTSIAALTGSFTGKYGGVFKDHAVLAGSSANPNRLAFSNAADPTTWDLTLQVWDASFPLTGLGFCRGGIILFQGEQTEIIRGSIPPPGGDFVMTPLVSVGCLDARSIVNWHDQVIWCSSEGVFMTDGTNTVDIALRGGMSSYYRGIVNRLINTPTIIVSGIYRNHLVISFMTNSFVEDTLVCDLSRGIWWTFSNIKMLSAAQVHSSPEELYFYPAGNAAKQVATMSPCWSPGLASDGNGTAVTWTIESAMHRGFMRLHRRWITSQAVQTWRALYLDYDMRDSATPTIRLSVLDDDPSSSNYTDLTAGVGQPPDPTLTTAWKRIRMLINHPSNGFAYRLQSSNAAGDTRIYQVEAEYAGREGSRIR